MKLVIERSRMHGALHAARAAVDNSSKIPITTYVRLTAKRDRLTIDASDFDLMLSVAAPAEIEREGAIAVPATALWDLVRFAPEGSEIGLDLQGERLTVKAGRSSAKLLTLPAEDFPDVARAAREEPRADFVVPGDQLTRMLGDTAWAMATNENDPVLYGTHFHLAEIEDLGRRLACVTCNRREIARSLGPVPTGLDALEPFTLPRKASLLLASILAGVKSDVAIGVDENGIAIQAGETVLASKLIAMPYVDYVKVIPREPATRAHGERGAIADLVSRVGAFAAERKSDNVTWQYIEIDFAAEGRIAARSTSTFGSIADEVEAEIDGETVPIAVDPKCLQAALKAMSGQDLAIDLMGRGKPIVLRDRARDDFLAVVSTKTIATPMPSL